MVSRIFEREIRKRFESKCTVKEGNWSCFYGAWPKPLSLVAGLIVWLLDLERIFVGEPSPRPPHKKNELDIRQACNQKVIPLASLLFYILNWKSNPTWPGRITGGSGTGQDIWQLGLNSNPTRPIAIPRKLHDFPFNFRRNWIAQMCSKPTANKRVFGAHFKAF